MIVKLVVFWSIWDGTLNRVTFFFSIRGLPAKLLFNLFLQIAKTSNLNSLVLLIVLFVPDLHESVWVSDAKIVSSLFLALKEQERWSINQSVRCSYTAAHLEDSMVRYFIYYPIQRLSKMCNPDIRIWFSKE